MIWALTLYVVTVAALTWAILIRRIGGFHRTLLVAAVLLAAPGYSVIWGSSRKLADGGGANNSLAFMLLVFGALGFALTLLARLLLRSRLSR